MTCRGSLGNEDAISGDYISLCVDIDICVSRPIGDKLHILSRPFPILAHPGETAVLAVSVGLEKTVEWFALLFTSESHHVERGRLRQSEVRHGNRIGLYGHIHSYEGTGARFIELGTGRKNGHGASHCQRREDSVETIENHNKWD